jgi:hypothetical protein
VSEAISEGKPVLASSEGADGDEFIEVQERSEAGATDE